MNTTSSVCPECGAETPFGDGRLISFCPGCGRLTFADGHAAATAEDAVSLLASGESALNGKNLGKAFTDLAGCAFLLPSKDLAFARDRLPKAIASAVTSDLSILQTPVRDAYFAMCDAFGRRGFDLAGDVADTVAETVPTGMFNADMTRFFAFVTVQSVAIEMEVIIDDIYSRCKGVQDVYYDYRGALKDGEGKTLFGARSMYSDAIKPFVFLGGQLNARARRMTVSRKEAFDAVCRKEGIPAGVRGLVMDAVGWQVRRMATGSLKENSRCKSNMKKDMKAFCKGYFDRAE